MPKDKSDRDYSGHGKAPAAVSQGNSLDEDEYIQEWQDARCPICMEIPHNAVLLKCSSYMKGCRPYMCDTSYRHSNCLDQYRKARAKTVLRAHEDTHEYGSVQSADNMHTSSTNDLHRHFSLRMPLPSRSIHVGTNEQGGSHFSESLHNEVLEDTAGHRTLQSPERIPQIGASSLHGCDLVGLLCPLCSGQVKGWEVVKAARHHLNKKARSCAREACSFVGLYEELRAHARREHPAARPAEVDPARHRDWRHLERQQDLGDVLSTIRSAMPGATIFGDYVIDGQEDHLGNYNSDFPNDEGHLLTVFLLFQVFGPAHSFTGGRVFPHFRGVLRDRHRTGSTRRELWGEILQRTLTTEGDSTSGAGEYGEVLAGSTLRRHRRSQGRF